MEPNHWNYNQVYGRIPPASLTTGHSTINRLDFPLLDQAALGSGLGLPPSLSPHPNLTTRSLGPMPGVGYPGHPMHSGMPQFIDPMSELQGAISQPTYKPMHVSQSPFPFDSTGRSSVDLPANFSPVRHTSVAPSSTIHTKPTLFSPTELHSKELLFSSPTSQASLESTAKGWGLSNFLPGSTNPFGSIAEPLPSDFGTALLLSQSQQTPPPAHSTSSRVSTIQRNPYSAEMLCNESSRPTKTTASPLHSPREQLLFSSGSGSFGRSSDTVLSSKSSSVPSQGYTTSPPQIKDLSAHAQNPHLYSTYITSSTYNPISSANPVYTASPLADMDYDPVSPATPLSATPQPADPNPFSTVSLQDLAELGTAQGSIADKRSHGEAARREAMMQQEQLLRSSMEKSSRLPKDVGGHVQGIPSHHVTMQHTPPGVHNGQNMQGVSSPMQQSPISVGSPQMSMSVPSPQISMPMGSPQSLMPSSTVVQAPPPVQAIPDSTTKPKRGRGGRGGGGRPRKKKGDNSAAFMGNLQQPPMFGEMAQQQQQQQQQHQQQPPQQTAFLSNQGYMADSHAQDVNQTYMHADSSPSLAQNMRQMSAGQTPESMQRSPMEEPFVQQQQQQQQQQSVSNPRLQSLSDDLLSRHSSMSSLNSGHQASPMQDAMTLNHQQSVFCDGMVGAGGQHTSPLTNNPSPPNQMIRNTDSSSMTSHSALSDSSSLDQRGSMLSAVRETDAIMSADQYGINGFVDNTPFMDSLTENPPVTQAMEYQGHMMSPEMNNPGSYQDPMNNSMHMDQFGGSFGISQDQAQLTGMEIVAESGGSTIDEMTFSSLFGSPLPEKGRLRTKAEQKLMPIVTITPSVEQDDELCHLSVPPQSVSEPVSQSKDEDRRRKDGGSSFQDSFLSYLMGKKQETLESLTTATIHKKPQLPKYIPEPKRPRPPTPQKSEESSEGSSKEDGSWSGYSESDDSVTKTVDNVNVRFSDEDYDDNSREPAERKSKDLTIRISLKRSPRGGATCSRGGRKPKAKGPRVGKGGKSKGSGELGEGVEPEVEDEPFIPQRERISRRAKEKAMAKKKKKSDSESSSDDENIHSINRNDDSEKDYDSDKDPAWTPFEVDIRQPTYDDAIGDKSRRNRRLSARGRPIRIHSRSGIQRSSEFTADHSEQAPSTKVAKLSPLDAGSDVKNSELGVKADSEKFAIGKYILEKKDMHNYESYPIWKIEHGRMIHKYEIFSDLGRVRHKAVPTYSSWMSSMTDQFLPISVMVLSQKEGSEVVQVSEECRPKPPTDGSLETKYEDDPLVDLFNVYIQIFLSQALEPGFLSAITDSQDNFYLSALEKIDKLIVKRLEEIDKKVKWKMIFKETLKTKPQLREIDRPNLKQSCQACENSSPPTIKTVHFLGNPYDRFDLDELPETRSVSAEFNIGKIATQYVGIYHSLYHFKYNLYKRCLAKVKLLQDSGTDITNEKLLDQCLHNRAWVLKIFEDLKRMLEKG